MQRFENQHYLINYPVSLVGFVNQSVENAEERIPILEKLFDFTWEQDSKIKARFFDDKYEFDKYIEKVGGFKPRASTVGCFCQGEIQTYVDIKNLNNQYPTTLAHETVHLFFMKAIYNPKEIQRIRWFDEAYSYYLQVNRENEDFNKFYLAQANKLKDSYKNLDVNFLDDFKVVASEKYNTYAIFQVIGKYIFDNNLQKEYLTLLKTDTKKLRAIGKTILEKAVDYILSACRE